MDASREAAQAATLVEACKAASLSHVVWSTLEDTRAFERPGERMPALGPAGQYCVPHFDEKGAADAKWRAAGVPTTFLRTSFFFEVRLACDALLLSFLHENSHTLLTKPSCSPRRQNFLPSAGMGLEPRRDAPGGPLLLRLPMARARLSGIAVADIGGCAAGCFLDPKGTVNATIGIAGDHLTGDEYASVFTKVLGKEVKYEAVDFEAFRARGGDAMRDMANMFQFYVDFEARAGGGVRVRGCVHDRCFRSADAQPITHPPPAMLFSSRRAERVRGAARRGARARAAPGAADLRGVAARQRRRVQRHLRSKRTDAPSKCMKGTRSVALW